MADGGGGRGGRGEHNAEAHVYEGAAAPAPPPAPAAPAPPPAPGGGHDATGRKAARWKKLEALKQRRLEVRTPQHKYEQRLKRRILRKALKALEGEQVPEADSDDNDDNDDNSNDGDDGRGGRDGRDASAREPTPQAHADPREQQRQQVNQAFAERFLPHMDANKHLKPLPEGDLGKKSAQHRRLDALVDSGRWEEASRLSDTIAQDELAGKMREAGERREFAAQLQREREVRYAKRKPQLHWRFVIKERWERKGNM